MLTVKTSVKPSSIEGLGLFAEEKISQGDTVWKFNPKFDIFFDPKEVEKMTPAESDLIIRYAYLSPEMGKYVYCLDNTRFMNHSATNDNLEAVPFPGEPETRAIAQRDIGVGEELLIDYRTIDTHDAKSNEEYLKN